MQETLHAPFAHQEVTVQTRQQLLHAQELGNTVLVNKYRPVHAHQATNAAAFQLFLHFATVVTILILQHSNVLSAPRAITAAAVEL